MTFEQVSLRAIEYAERGFPLRPRTASAIDANRKFIDAWPDNQRNWLKPDGTAYKAGDTITLPDLARTLSSMVEAERKAKKKGRGAGIAAARDRFYKGDIAREMVAFLKAHQAPWELADFSEYFARIEAPAMTTYRGYDVYKQSFGSQGPVLLEALNILEQFDLKSMQRNSGPYLHTVVEALKLAYADRDSYYGDQAFVESPAEGLLSKEYAKERARQIDAQQASKAYLAGDPLRFDSKVKSWNYWIANLADATQEQQPAREEDLTAGVVKDTTHISVIDREGNVFDSTPSGAWIPTSPILGRTGIAMSVRGESFWLDPSRAGQLRPRSRPRYTLTPTHRAAQRSAVPGDRHARAATTRSRPSSRRSSTSWNSGRSGTRISTTPSDGRACRRCTSTDPSGRIPRGFNKLNVESDMPEAVYEELRRRGTTSARSRRRASPAARPRCCSIREPATASRPPIRGATVTRSLTDELEGAAA